MICDPCGAGVVLRPPEFHENADWVVEMCGQVKVKYGVDSKCVIEIVKAALLRGIETDLSLTQTL